MDGDTSTGEADGAVTSRPVTGGRFANLGQLLAGELVHAWPLDLVNAAAITAGVLTHSVVIWFHIVFLVQAVAALLLPFRRFALRCAFWTAVSAALVAVSVVQGHTPAVELSELPLLTMVLILVYLGAQARAHVVDQLTKAQQEIIERSQHELDSLRHQVEQAQRLELLGRASLSSAHDLRNVFSVINGCAEELNQEMYGRRAATRVLEIMNATDRASAIVSDLQETGLQRPMDDGPIDLRAMVSHLEPLLQRLTPPAIQLSMSTTNDPVCVRMDRTSLLQILMNLVVNATDAIDGAGRVTVRCEREVLPSGPGAVLSVSDTGRGIPEEVREQMFEPGFTTKAGAHSGLGLATVRRLVDRWQGTIDIDSTAVSGTTVRVVLPLFDGTERRRALVVVDDAGARQLLVAALAELDVDVTEVGDSLEACDAIMGQPPADYVVLDEAAASDPGLARVARLSDVRCVHVLAGSGQAGHRLPTDRAGAADVVRVLRQRRMHLAAI